MTELSRRSFFSRAALLTVGSGLCAGTFNLEAIAAAPKTARSLAEVLAMSDVEMARQSAVVQAANRVIIDAARQLRNEALREKTLSILDNPVPTIAQGNEKAILSELKREKLIDASFASVFPPSKVPSRSGAHRAQATPLITPIPAASSFTRRSTSFLL